MLPVAFGYVKTLGFRNSHFEAVPALQGARTPLRPTGFSVYASPILFAAVDPLRHGRKTRYGWVANPFPTGTFTPQDMPSFARRDNDWHVRSRLDTALNLKCRSSRLRFRTCMPDPAKLPILKSNFRNPAGIGAGFANFAFDLS